MSYRRRKNIVSKPFLVNLPKYLKGGIKDYNNCNEYRSSGEGGVEFYLGIPSNNKNRHVCITEEPVICMHNCVLGPKEYVIENTRLHDEWAKNKYKADSIGFHHFDVLILLGSTGLSLWKNPHTKEQNDKINEEFAQIISKGDQKKSQAFLDSQDSGYFIPTYNDLTDEGKKLYDLIGKIYGGEPMIITLLDT